MQKNKIPVISIIFYVLAVVLLAYAIWAATYSINYISTAIEQNQLVVQGYEFEVASFYMTNVAQYVVFAALLFGIGWLLQKLEWENSVDFYIEEDEDYFEDEESDELEEQAAEEELEE